MFVDEVRIKVKGGRGGAGVVAFRREKYVPRGGPAGGNGGRGGNVVFRADPNLTTLLDFRYQQNFAADSGDSGAGTRKHGQDGGDIILKAPVGTMVYVEGSDYPVADLSEPGQEFIAARGGRGGRGNSVFANSTRQAPRFAERGEPGEERTLRLELKLLADVGLVGFPNVGKSTLIAACTAAQPKIADYPFTTLVPNLGVVQVEDRSFVMADIPGLIEGASEGLGIGHRFLRHIERTRVIFHILDVSGLTGRDPVNDYHVLRRELAAYSAALADLPEIIALNKTDIPGSDALADQVEVALADGPPIYRISAATVAGVDALLYAALRALDDAPLPKPASMDDDAPLFTGGAPDMEFIWNIHRAFDGAWVLEGQGVERRVVMTDMNSDEGVRRLHRQLEKMGVLKSLRKAGAKHGDTVRIAEIDLDFVEEHPPVEPPSEDEMEEEPAE